MLTDSEKRWLHDRKLSPNPYCGWCMNYALCCSPLFTKCPTKTADLGDALEFEAQVAAKLADWLARDMGCYICGEKVCKLQQKDRSCREKLLQAARLAVEEEMDESKAIRR